MISIIIPVFNSENTIEILIDNIVEGLGKHYEFEIILINDSSVDRSEEKSKKLGKISKNSDLDFETFFFLRHFFFKPLPMPHRIFWLRVLQDRK